MQTLSNDKKVSTAEKLYDLIIIGGGPAGLTAAIYAQRAKLNCLLLEKVGLGGQIALSDVIENYPGVGSLSGAELMAKFEEQARSFGAQINFAEVEKVEDKGSYRTVKTTSEELKTKTVLIATGAKPRKLGVPGEAIFAGKGVSYCATCDGFFFRGKDVVVVGGGDTAVKEAVYLSKLAQKVTVIHRRDQLRAEKIIQEKAFAQPNINFIWNSVVTEISGQEKVSSVKVKNVKTNIETDLKTDGVFIFIGITPNADFIDAAKDKNGFIITDKFMATSMPGVYAAGDVRDTPLRQVATAVGDAAIAVASIGELLS